METELCACAPPDWQIRSIEDVCERVTSGGTPRRHNPAYYAGGTWPWVKTQELKDTWVDDTEEHITDEAIHGSSAKVLPTNTVLLAMYGATVGQLGMLRKPMTCNQACCAIIVDRGKADSRYLFYLLLSARPQLKGLATGAAQQNLSGELIRQLRFPFPGIDEQRAIARILGTLDDKIELNRRMNETLETIARALFKSWFVDFDPVRAKAEGRDPSLPKPLADLFPSRLVDSELGDIPEGWRVGSIGELADVVGGSTPSTKEAAYWEKGSHSWATPKDLSGLSVPVLLETGRRITDAGLAQIPSGLLPPGTVLLSSRAPIGYLAIAEVPVAINQGFIAMRPKEGVPSLFLLLWAVFARDDIVSRANGSTFQEISKMNFRPIPLVAPPARVMQAFDEVVRPFYRRIVENERESRALAALRDVLLPKLISGDLRVRDSERFITGTPVTSSGVVA